MKKLATWVALVALVVGGGLAVFWPTDFWRLFDANQRPLALTEAENWCSGYIGMGQQRFIEDDPAVARCMDTQGLENETPSIANSVYWACQGIRQAGWLGSSHECQDLFAANQLWMLAGGGFTTEWNDAYPRPVALDEGVLEEPNGRSNRSEGAKVPVPVTPDNTDTEDSE